MEPRKNISIVIEFITNNPSVLNEYTFVFAGRDGWLDERANLESKLAALNIPSHKVVFTGFLSDALKLALLMRAEFTIFASFFEGFGLPVAESLLVGCPVLCSQSSSLTEVIDSLLRHLRSLRLRQLRLRVRGDQRTHSAPEA